MNTLAELLSSRVKAEIFRLLFGPSGVELHVREIERRSGLADATVRQELKRLSRLGVVEPRRDGNRRYYHANTEHPLYPDIRNMVLKTSGLADVLRDALTHSGIRLAFVFGSMARSNGKAGSDVDLMVIGTISLRQLGKLLSGVATKLGREVNPHVLTPEEFVKRRKARDHFITTVLSQPRLFVTGSEDELKAMGR
ncbi:MAG TPA: nucleotidyltransferase domain-containing protein [Acidobacteriota bacterium]|nr:nucleotidyltransferase domain-containing protein [Acidobacteriota bacterium]